ncbi:MAG: very short patch repair endonuclease, partial [Segetibacter sp.]
HRNCKYFKYPKTRTDYWKHKIDGNKTKDKKAVEEIKKYGWNVLTIWECKLKANNAPATLDNLLKHLL